MFVIVFSEEDKNKLSNKGLKYIGTQGNGFVFRDNGQVVFEKDIKIIRTETVCL